MTFLTQRGARACRLPRAPTSSRGGTEDAEGTGEAMHVRPAPHRADLAVTEEAAEGHAAEEPAEDGAVVIGLAVQVHTPPETGKEQSPDRILRFGTSSETLQHQLQVVIGGAGVTHVELDALPLVQVGADGNGTVARIDAENVADEEIARTERRRQLVHGETEEERLTHELAIA